MCNKNKDLKQKKLKILVLGAGGQIGSALLTALGPEAGIGLKRRELDFSSGDFAKTFSKQLKIVLEQSPLDGVINAAAYTQVDQAEVEKALAERVNTLSVGILAELCAKKSIPLIHYSTDYVFNGTKKTAWTEEDQPAPVNHYGLTKLNGEKELQEKAQDWMVLRTSWVYSERGNNFFRTMLRLAQEREELKVVDDQIGAPSYAGQLAQASLKVLALALQKKKLSGQFPSGIYHFCNQGQSSWFHFAQEIFRQASEKGLKLKVKRLQAIASTDFPTLARRPLNSRLEQNKLKREFHFQLASWQEGLRECLEKFYEQSYS